MATPEASRKSSSTVATRGWALDKADATVRVKPRRPYTPYNLFYLLERELVVQGHEPSLKKEKAEKNILLEKERAAAMGERAEGDIPLPQRYNGVVMLPMWYEPNLKEKRKHRKTHGKISFKDLTAIISKNWASIDVETKGYCTNISEMGRKRYKAQITRYNASQKIIQLKEEHAAMESAKAKRMVQFKKKQCKSPPRSGNVDRNPVPAVTPDRILSHHAPVIVTPPNNGYNNRPTMYIPSSSPHPFHHYGPPPPLPPPMTHMQGQHQPPPMPSYHHHHHPHHPHHHQYHHRPHYNYPQPPPMDNSALNQGMKMNKSHNTQGMKANSNIHSQAMKTNSSIQNQVTKTNIIAHNQVMKTNNSSYNQDTKMNSSNNAQGIKINGGSQYQGRKLSDNGLKQIRRLKSDYEQARTSGMNFFSNLPNSGVGVTVDVNVSVQKDDTTNSRSSMTHDEAMQLCNLMGSNDAENGGGHLPDTLLREMPSFDFGDGHSLSTEDDCDMSMEMSGNHYLQVENQEDNMLDAIRSELLPLELSGEEAFPDFGSDFHELS